MTTKLVTLYGRIRPIVDGISEPMVLRHAQRVAVDFFRRSLAWREDDTAFLVGGYPEAAWPRLEASGNEVMVAATHSVVDADGFPLKFASPFQLDRHEPNWRTEQGRVHTIVLLGNRFRVVQVPTSDMQVVGHLSFMPALTSTEIPEEQFDRWHEALLEGTLARLFAEKPRPWFDGSMAQYHQGQYEYLLDQARREAGHEQHAGGLMSYGGI